MNVRPRISALPAIALLLPAALVAGCGGSDVDLSELCTTDTALALGDSISIILGPPVDNSIEGFSESDVQCAFSGGNDTEAVVLSGFASSDWSTVDSAEDAAIFSPMGGDPMPEPVDGVEGGWVQVNENMGPLAYGLVSGDGWQVRVTMTGTDVGLDAAGMKTAVIQMVTVLDNQLSS